MWFNGLKSKHKPGDVLEEIDPHESGRPIRYLILGEYNPQFLSEERQKEKKTDKYVWYHAVRCFPWTIWGHWDVPQRLYSEEWDDHFICIGNIDLSLLMDGNMQIKMDLSKSDGR